jgi:alpha-1,3/alpha-1,6-mannosyltransferase
MTPLFKYHYSQAHEILQVTNVERRTGEEDFDVFFVDQLSTCIPLLRWITRRRVVFYCHFPDKLLAEGEFIDEDDKGSLNNSRRVKKGGLLKRLYRLPMDWLEEKTTGQS